MQEAGHPSISIICEKLTYVVGAGRRFGTLEGDIRLPIVVWSCRKTSLHALRPGLQGVTRFEDDARLPVLVQLFQNVTSSIEPWPAGRDAV